jgi:CRISPR-associated endonuclease/helicase Cas3
LDFAAHFRQVHGVDPFPWQRRAAALPDLPESVDVPTGGGKTALIDIWHWRLRHGRPGPRRVVWVVDRRTIVDQIYERASRLLRHDPDLRLLRLRGGVPDEEAGNVAGMGETLTRPTIIVSTVDQAGSRLLHRGYGLSPQAWPIHAGLLGHECWWVLDEAHLSQPLVETLEALRRFGVDIHVTQVSATLPGGVGRTVSIDEEDRSDPVLGPRLRASKSARLTKLRVASGEPGVAVGFVEELQRLVIGDRSIRVAAIVVNRVGLARDVWRIASKHFPDAEAVLLTGRSRPAERDALVAEILPRIGAGRDRSAETPLIIVVATQCIEAGADFDFDVLVTQIAPLDCLRQRFGRLDRLGLRGTSQAAIVACSDEITAKADDPVYGAAPSRTWSWLSEQANRNLVEMGAAIPTPADFSLLAPRASAPLLTSAQIDLWVQTMPVPSCSDDVAPWLHGPDAGPADVQVVWRADISDDLTGAVEILAACPPVAAEALPLPVWTVQAWLRGTAVADPSDAEGEPVSEENRRQRDAAGRAALRWRGVDDGGTRRVFANSVAPGATIVVPASYGGCDRYGWAPDSKMPVADIGRRKGVIRVHPAVHPDWLTLAPLFDPEDPAPLLRALGVVGRIAYRYGGNGCIVHHWPARDTKAGQPVTLEDHSRAVEAEARAAAEALGLPATDIALGAYFHDQGKIDDRAQIVLHGGELAWLASTVSLAKSARIGGRLLPPGVRHEAHSSQIARGHPRLAEAGDPDLVLWLVATHHGHGRPGWPAATIAEGWVDEAAWADRHARLLARYGPWQLAAMEAVVRLTDQMVSARGGA